MNRLIVMMKNRPLKQVPLDGKRLVIGRVEGSDLMIDSPEVSRQHAEIVVVRSSVSVRDLNSTNGTFVNGSKVTLHTLHHGDVVRVGNCDIRYLSRGVVSFRDSQLSLAP